jgi:hypothetical protein
MTEYRGALNNLGYSISDTTVGNIPRDHGIEPAPERRRQSTWKTFLQAHWDILASIDFTTIEVWTKSGLIAGSGDHEPMGTPGDSKRRPTEFRILFQ